jgi:hypothetical protein
VGCRNTWHGILPGSGSTAHCLEMGTPPGGLGASSQGGSLTRTTKGSRLLASAPWRLSQTGFDVGRAAEVGDPAPAPRPGASITPAPASPSRRPQGGTGCLRLMVVALEEPACHAARHPTASSPAVG